MSSTEFPVHDGPCSDNTNNDLNVKCLLAGQFSGRDGGVFFFVMLKQTLN